VSLLAPLFLFGLAATLLPWWLHRLSASNPPKQDFGSTQFLESTQSTSARKKRIRHWWLLLLRVLFLGLLCLLFAEPAIERLKGTGSSEVRHIIVVDNSLSQSLDGRWQRTMSLANEVVDQAAGSDEIIVIAASDKFTQLQTDNSGSAAKSQLNSLSPGNSRLDYGRIASAVTAAVTDSEANNHLHIITDAQASSLPAKFTALAVDKVQKLKVYSSASENDINASVNGKISMAQDDTANVVAIINNYGAATTRTVTLATNSTTTAGAKTLAEHEIEIAANSSVVHHFTNIDIASAEEQLNLSLSPADALPADDVWLLPLSGKERSEITLLVGNTERTVAASYVKAALESDTRFSARLIEADRFSNNDTGNLIIVPDAAALSDRATIRLRDFIKDGGSVLMAAGSQPHSAEMKSLTGANAAIERGSDTSVGNIDKSHQITSGTSGNWRAISVLQHVALDSSVTDRRIIDLPDGTPLLLEKRIGAGKLILLATALDTDWTDLATESVFVAFVIKAVDYLGGGTATAEYRSTGDAMTLRAGAQLMNPEGEPMRDLSTISERTSVTLDRPGVYQLRNAAGTQRIAVNSDSRESDISTIDQETIDRWQQMTAADKAVTATGKPADKNYQGFWLWLLPLLLCVALLESLYSHRHLWIRRKA